jgi:hypothetical protein
VKGVRLISPKDHPNATAALVAGYVASAIIYGTKKAGVDLTVEEASTAASALIALVLFAAGKAAKTDSNKAAS